jgi:cytochrome c biogenesis protein CcdA
MGSLLTTGSILAAFFAGAVALFAPCCIVFLLPAYVATAVKNRRWRLLPLTFVFAAGLGLVLIPVTLGVSILSSSLAHFHRLLYFFGGFLLLALAVLSLLGRSWSMPHFIKAPSLERADAGGMFLLGVFSGVASSCCAPVVAGVMAMSALAGSTIGSLALGTAYVFGMSFPLFMLALLWDKLHLGERRIMQARPITLRAWGHELKTNTMNLFVSVMFAAMGAMVLVLAANGNTTSAPSFQIAFGRWLSRTFTSIAEAVRPVPEPILGLGLLALAGIFVVATLHGRKTVSGGDDDERNCCEAEQGSLEEGAVGKDEPEPAR